MIINHILIFVDVINMLMVDIIMLEHDILLIISFVLTQKSIIYKMYIGRAIPF